MFPPNSHPRLEKKVDWRIPRSMSEDKFAALRTKIFTESIETSNEPRSNECDVSWGGSMTFGRFWG